MDYTKYLGAWMNTFRKGHTIDQFRLFEEHGTLMIETEVSGVVKNWGKAPAISFVQENDPEKVVAFEVSYDLDATKHHLCLNDSKGLLVVTGFHSIKDNSGRKPFFTREFFYKV